MIQMIRGIYGLVDGDTVRPMTKDSGPFELPEAREAELIAAGVAVRVEKPASPYDGMTIAKLRGEAAARGVGTAGLKTKQDIIGALVAADTAPSAPDDETLA